MSIPADTHEIASLTNAVLCTLLEEAEKQERECRSDGMGSTT